MFRQKAQPTAHKIHAKQTKKQSTSAKKTKLTTTTPSIAVEKSVTTKKPEQIINDSDDIPTATKVTSKRTTKKSTSSTAQTAPGAEQVTQPPATRKTRPPPPPLHPTQTPEYHQAQFAQQQQQEQQQRKTATKKTTKTTTPSSSQANTPVNHVTNPETTSHVSGEKKARAKKQKLTDVQMQQLPSILPEAVLAPKKKKMADAKHTLVEQDKADAAASQVENKTTSKRQTKKAQPAEQQQSVQNDPSSEETEEIIIEIPVGDDDDDQEEDEVYIPDPAVLARITKKGKRGKSPTTTSRSTFKKLQQQFLRVRGDDAIEILRRCARDSVNVIAIGGNQLTGKSTLCNNLMMQLSQDHYDYGVKHNKTPFHITFLSAGQVFRSIANMRGLEVGELSKLAQQTDDIDINIEYETCKGIMGGINYTGRNVEGLMNLVLDKDGRAIGTVDQIEVDTNVTNNFDDPKELEYDMLSRNNKSMANIDADTDDLEFSEGQEEEEEQQQQQQQTPPTPPTTKPTRVKHFLPPRYPEHTLIVEGRNPAVMAAYCETILGKKNVTTVYLHCSVREQAVRYLSREVGKELATEIGSLLPPAQYKTLSQVGKDLKVLLNAIQTNTYHTLPFAQPDVRLHPQLKKMTKNAHKIVDQFEKNETRDQDDMLRYRKTYDFPPELDYNSKYLYDIIIDTSDVQAQDTLAAVYSKLPKHLTVLDEFYINQERL